MTCIFCDIIDGKIPAKKIAENTNAVCFEDISPQAPYHFLVIPKKHLSNVLGFDTKNDTLVNDVFDLIQTVIREHNLEASGCRIVNNLGDDGGQTVDHVHFHVLGGRKLTWPPG